MRRPDIPRSHNRQISLDSCIYRAMIALLSNVAAYARRSPMVPGWKWEHSNPRGEIAADAERLIARFAERAYFEARDRVAGRCIDGTKSRRYWTRVKLEIAARQGLTIGLAGADAWA